MAVRKTTKRLYLIPVLSKALDILELLQAENQPLTLEAIHRQTRISKTTVYRVLKTFVHRGYLVAVAGWALPAGDPAEEAAVRLWRAERGHAVLRGGDGELEGRGGVGGGGSADSG